MKRKLIILGAVIFMGYCFYSCKKDQYATVNPQNLNFNYFPLKKGDSIIYKVDSFKYNTIASAIDTYAYYVLQYIKDTFTDNSGRLAYKLDRFWKKEPLDSWTQENVWQEQIVSNTAQTFEENIRYVRLEFPIVNGFSWNGNEYNNIDSLGIYNYTYTSAFQPWAGVYNKTYDSTVTVMQANTADSTSPNFNYLYRFYSYEVYAANVGLVYKYFAYTDYSNAYPNPNGPGELNVVGFGIKQTIYYCSYHK